jgi:hypothetical protein
MEPAKLGAMGEAVKAFSDSVVSNPKQGAE